MATADFPYDSPTTVTGRLTAYRQRYPYAAVALAALVLARLADGLTTAIGLAVGLREAAPVSAAVLDTLGVAVGLPVWTLLAIGVCVAIGELLRAGLRDYDAVLARLAPAALYSGAAVAFAAVALRNAWLIL